MCRICFNELFWMNEFRWLKAWCAELMARKHKALHPCTVLKQTNCLLSSYSQKSKWLFVLIVQGLKSQRSLGLSVWRSWCYWNAATRRAQLIQVVLSWAACFQSRLAITYAPHPLRGRLSISHRHRSVTHIHRLPARRTKKGFQIKYC